MKLLFSVILFCSFIVASAQTVTPQPIEERHDISYWWWIVGVAVALALGIGLYLLIKKDPRRDAV